MNADLKPYPAMKDSGVPWLGEVPAHWEVAALRHRYAQCLGKMLDSKRLRGEHSVPYLRNVDVQWDRINTSDLPWMDIPPDQYERYTVKPGDLLVCEGGEVGRCAIWRGEIALCGFQKALHRLRPRLAVREDPRFLYYALTAASASGAFVDGHESTIAHLTGDKLRAHRFPFPPLREQSAIVRFLDHADGRIRRYIRSKRRLIALLNEQKRTITHHAVTRGLDLGVRLKPSGVAWLREVPAHWEVRKLRHCGQVRGGMTPSMEDRSLWGGTIPWVTPKDMKSFEINGSIDHVSSRALEQTALTEIPVPAVLLVVRGMILARRVPVGVTMVPVTINQDMKALIPAPGCEAAFLGLALESAHEALEPLIDEAGHGTRRLPTERWRELPVALPPRDEQVAIAARIAAISDDVDRALRRLQGDVGLLREYRSRLIADVVTGKLDVREAAARLPVQGVEPEVVEDADAESEGGQEADPALEAGREDAEE